MTDGIFAVSMTLLVLDLKFPEHPEGPRLTLFDELLQLVARLDNYVISFVVLATFWMSHVRMLGRMREADPLFTGFNLAFLLFTTFVPPLTSVLGQHPEMPRAAVLYGANLLMILWFETLCWKRAIFVLSDDAAEDRAALWRRIRDRNLMAMSVVILAVVVALVEIRVGVSQGFAPWIYLLLIAVGIMRPPIHKK